MSRWIVDVLAVLFVIVMWSLCNWTYRWIHGRPLRWRYLWAAHGALMFARRLPKYEKRDAAARGGSERDER